MTDKNLLFSAPGLALANEATREALRKSVILLEVPKDTVLIRAGAVCDVLFILLDGRIDIGLELEGREHLLDVKSAFSILAVDAVICHEIALCSYKTASQCSIAMVPAQIFRDCVVDDQELSSGIIFQLAVNSRTLTRQINNLKLRDATERLLAWLRSEHRKSGYIGSFHMPYTKRTLARLLGIDPATLSRTLSSLEKMGVRVKGSFVELGPHFNSSSQPLNPLLDELTVTR